MSGADRLRAQAARATTRRARTEPNEGEPVEVSPDSTRPAPRRPAATPRTKTVRVTLDLAPLQYRRLNRWCDDAADELGVARVTAASVLRELLTQLEDDPELSKRIRANLKASD